MRGDVKRKILPFSPIRGGCSAACIQPDVGWGVAVRLPSKHDDINNAA
jgi:hypothetical protein